MSNKFKILITILVAIFNSFNCFSQGEASEIQKVVYKWSEAHNNNDTHTFQELFSQKVLFYGKEITKESCITKKINLLRTDGQFKQFVASDISISYFINGIIKCEFTKKVYYKGKIKNYPSYLLLQKINESYLIVGESDVITDSNLNFTLNLGQQISEPAANENHFSWLNNELVIVGSLGIILFILVIFKRNSLKKIESQPSFQNKFKLNSSYANQNKIKGDKFEEFIVNKFDKNYFTLKNWRSDKSVGGIFPESNMYPDLEYEFKYNQYIKKFAIECKYRVEPSDGFIELAKPEQFIRYKKFQEDNKMEVYLVLGLGGKPFSPNQLFLIPLNKITSPKINIHSLKSYNKLLEKRFFYNTEIHCLT